MRILILVVWMGCYGLTWAQSGLSQYDWTTDRKQTELTSAEQTIPEYIIKSYRSLRYEWENGNLVAYQTEHRITKVNNTNAIERHNRIYVSMRNVESVVQLKARSINKAGRVTNFDQKNLKEVKDEKTDNTYRIFAIEGIEAESEIEYFYVLKLNPRLQDTYYVQLETSIRDLIFKITCPKNLKFDFRVYNDDQLVQADTLTGYKRYTYNRKAIPGLQDEAFTFTDAYKKRIEYKLAYNFSRSGARLNTWADAGRVFYRDLVKTDANVEKELTKFVKTIQDNSGNTPVQRIRNVENKVKTAIRINTNSPDPKLKETASILKSRQANGEGIAKILLLTYERLGIPVQLVITCSREYAHFDGGFDTWAYLDEYLFYFPETGGFLAPDKFELRYPLIPRELSGQQGLFIEPISISNIKTGIAFIRDIPALPFTADQDNLDIEVKFSSDLDVTQVLHTRTFKGYDAASMVSYYDIMSTDQRQKFVEEIFSSSIPDIKLDKWDVKTSMTEEFPKMTLATAYHTGNFLEKAGPRTLFKIGELIGPQSELYSEDERKLPIENTHNRGYDRIIRFSIPDGYKIDNLDALKFSVKYTDDDRVPFAFISDYSVNGRQVTIKIEEYYKELFAPLARYEDFRKVVNAAADFNKVTLVLTAQ
jgi:hypothetical protein